MQRSSKNIGLVSTAGGHFEQMLNLHEVYGNHNHFWITNPNKQTESQLANERKYFVPLGHYKKPWTYFAQAPKILKIFSKERPSHVISTGSGRTALLPFFFAKLFRRPFLHIDTFSRVHGFSKFGEFLVRVNCTIYSQWQTDHDNAIYVGPIFSAAPSCAKPPGQSHVFVTLGTRTEPFVRLLSAVDNLVAAGCVKDRVVVQAGHTKYASPNLEIFDFCPAEDIDDLILRARYVITQESAGISTKCLKSNTPFIVMPRDFQHGELPVRSDMKEDLHWKLAEMGFTKVVQTQPELEAAVRGVREIKTGFVFDNTLAISTLRTALEAS